jgi:hypothetical protein
MPKLFKYYLIFIAVLSVLFFINYEGFYLAGYIIYSSIIAFFAVGLYRRKMPMGLAGTEEIWTGKKAILISSFILILLIIGGVSYKNFDLNLFAFSIPVGIILGYFSHKLFISVETPRV